MFVRWLSIAAIALAVSFGWARAAPVDEAIAGVWATEGGGSHVQIHECADAEGLCGTLIWSRGGSGKRLGTKLLKNFQRTGARAWDHGKIVDPRDGSDYRAELELTSGDALKVRGCWFIFCRGQTWRRVSAERARIDPDAYEPPEDAAETEKP